MKKRRKGTFDKANLPKLQKKKKKSEPRVRIVSFPGTLSLSFSYLPLGGRGALLLLREFRRALLPRGLEDALDFLELRDARVAPPQRLQAEFQNWRIGKLAKKMSANFQNLTQKRYLRYLVSKR